VDVADGDSESVGGVGRLGRAVEREQAGDHELHLLLGGEAVAGDGGLDGERRVFGDGEVAGGGGQHGDSADLAELERGFGVGGEEDLLDGDTVGGVQGHQRGEFGVDLRETLRGLLFLVEANGSCGAVSQFGRARGRVHLDYSVAGELGAAVDSKDAHGESVNRRGSGSDSGVGSRHWV
jgi:hypothetical protein